MSDYSGISSIEDGEHELHPEEAPNDIQMHSLKYGGWAPTRIIHRKSPWGSSNQDHETKVPFTCKRTGEGVDIFMVDSGCYTPHPEFTGRAQQPFLLKPHYDTPMDDTDHGTGCLSVAGGTTLGLARQARLYSYKFHNGKSGASTTGFIKAMGAIKEHYEQPQGNKRPGVVFCSWGGFTPIINSAISDCIDVGLTCCFPAGNNRKDLDEIDYYPAEGDPDAIICGGINIHDRPYCSSDEHGTSYGSVVDIMAPGQQVVAARRIEDNGNYRFVNGTSYATPYVAGVLACMLEGYVAPSGREEVRALKAKLVTNATQGELKRGYAPGAKVEVPDDPKRGTRRLPDRILYLDPVVSFEEIPGLTPQQ